MFVLIRTEEGYFLMDPYLQYQRIAAGQAFLVRQSNKKCPKRNKLLKLSKNWDLEQNLVNIKAFVKATGKNPRNRFECKNDSAPKYQKDFRCPMNVFFQL